METKCPWLNPAADLLRGKAPWGSRVRPTPDRAFPRAYSEPALVNSAWALLIRRPHCLRGGHSEVCLGGCLWEPASSQLPEGLGHFPQSTKAPATPCSIGSILFVPEHPLSSTPEACHSGGQLGSCNIKCRSLEDAQRAMFLAASPRIITHCFSPHPLISRARQCYRPGCKSLEGPQLAKSQARMAILSLNSVCLSHEFLRTWDLLIRKVCSEGVTGQVSSMGGT